MSERVVLRPEVVAFAVLMETELQRHDHRGGWSGCAPQWLFGRLLDEVTDLYRTTSGELDDGTIGDPGEEAADVANFAMMIADVLGFLDVPETPVEVVPREGE